MNSRAAGVQQVLLAAHERARAVAVEDADGDDRREPVQRVQAGRLDVVARHQDGPGDRLGERRGLGDADRRPTAASPAARRQEVGAERPRGGDRVADDQRDRRRRGASPGWRWPSTRRSADQRVGLAAAARRGPSRRRTSRRPSPRCCRGCGSRAGRRPMHAPMTALMATKCETTTVSSRNDGDVAGDGVAVGRVARPEVGPSPGHRRPQPRARARRTRSPPATGSR